MTEQIRQQLKILIHTFAEDRNDLELCVDKIVELFQDNGQIFSTTGTTQRRRSSIFDGNPILPPTHATQRRRSSTYNEQGLVNNPDTVLYNNRDID